MIILLSPAKSLDFETRVSMKGVTSPQFLKRSTELMKILRTQSAAGLSKLMKLSDKLADLNVERNQTWKASHTEKNSKPAVYAFQGDVYQGLGIDDWKAAEIKRAQKSVRILSGLYGILRPLDLIQPYRLEMGTRLKNPAGKDLYDFWGETVSHALQEELAANRKRLVVNLASNEYSKAARLKSLDAEVITPAFRDWKNGEYKMISFFAKHARGLMTRFIIQNSVRSTAGLQDFNLSGYEFNAEMSTETTPVFTRRQ